MKKDFDWDDHDSIDMVVKSGCLILFIGFVTVLVALLYVLYNYMM